MNALCSYWVSSRDRVMNQMVVWEGEGRELGFENVEDKDDNSPLSLGAVTRRAIEKLG